MSNRQDEKEQRLEQWFSEVNSTYQANVKAIENVKWYQRNNVVLFTALVFIVFSAAYIATLNEYINELVSMSLQFFIMCISIVTVFVTFLGNTYKKNEKKMDEKHSKQLEQIKMQENSLFSSIKSIEKHSSLKTKIFMIYMVAVVLIGTVSGLLINELVAAMQSSLILSVVGFALLLLSLPYAINIFVKHAIFLKEYKKYRLNIDEIISESEKHFSKKISTH